MLHDNSPMPFGKYKGKKMAEIPATYLIWLFDNGVNHPEVKAYILDNLQGLKQEVSKLQKR